MTYYRTYSYGGMEGKTIEKRNFDTEGHAREWALLDTWDEGYTLYRIDVETNEYGMLIEHSTEIGDIPCGRELKWKKERD